MRAFNAAASYAADVGFTTHVFSQESIHVRCYRELRDRFGLSSQMAVRAIGKAVETFRRANLTRRVKLHIAFIVPGGRFTTGEIEDEFEDRTPMLKLMAETSGGKFVRIDQ